MIFLIVGVLGYKYVAKWSTACAFYYSTVLPGIIVKIDIKKGE